MLYYYIILVVTTLNLSQEQEQHVSRYDKLSQKGTLRNEH